MTESEQIWRQLEDPEAVRKMTPQDVFDRIQAYFEDTIDSFGTIRQKAKELADTLIMMCGEGATVKSTPPRRFQRKLIRWDERNRRRKLKGLPEKPNPYYGSVFFTVMVPIYYSTYVIPVETVIQEELDHAEMS